MVDKERICCSQIFHNQKDVFEILENVFVAVPSFYT